MNIPELIANLNKLPPAPVVIGAMTRLVQRAIVAYVAEKGPSPKYMAAMKAAGYDEDEARKMHNFVFDLETGVE